MNYGKKTVKRLDISLLHLWFKYASLILLACWLSPLSGAEPATSYRWEDRLSTYRAYWDDPRPLQAEALEILATLDPEKEPRRWLDVFCAFGMSHDSIHHYPKIAQHVRIARRLAEKLGDWGRMIDTLIIEESYVDSLEPDEQTAWGTSRNEETNFRYEKAIALAEEHNSPRDRNVVISNYLGFLKHKGNTTRIMQLLENAAHDLQSLANLSDIDRLVLRKNLIVLYKVVNRDELVAQMIQDLAADCLSLPYKSFCAYMLREYGVLFSAGRVPPDYPKAIEALTRAGNMAMDLGDIVIQSLSHLALANIALKQDKPELVLHHARIGAELAVTVGYHSNAAEAILVEAQALRQLKRYTEALSRLESLKPNLPSNLTSQHVLLEKLTADIHADLKSWELAYEARNRQLDLEKKFLEERGEENFSAQVVKLGLQLEQEKNKALRSENELQERRRKTILHTTLGVILIALLLLLGLVWVSRKNREIRKLHRFIETQVLQRFLPPKIVTDILTGKSHFEQTAQQRTVTVLFADLVSFTESAERMTPHDLTELLNRFFADMSEVVFEHGGVIDKFIGDAIMVVFGAPQELTPEAQAERSTRCALQLLQCLKRLNNDWQKTFHVTFAMRIGIHQGPAVVGTFGSERRSDYTVIGHTVNLASRIEGQAQPNQILVSESVARFLDESSKGYAGSFRLKGIEKPVPLFAISDAVDSIDSQEFRQSS